MSKLNVSNGATYGAVVSDQERRSPQTRCRNEYGAKVEPDIEPHG